VKPKIIIGAIAVVSQFFASHSSSLAAGYLTNINICSRFPHTIMFSMAYPDQGDGSASGDWISRGWLPIDTGYCYYFDNALRLPTFYFRAVSVPFRLNGRSVRGTWGDTGTNLKSFRVPKSTDVAYNYWRADVKSSVQRMDSFASFAIWDPKATVDAGHADLVLTFNADETTGIDLTLPAPK
jgi:Protein of unknown function (DUF1036)